MKLLLVSCMTVSSIFLLPGCGMLQNSASAVQQKWQKDRSSHDINEDNSGGGVIGDLKNIAPQVTASQLPAEEDIIWAPEDPNASIGELEELWTQPLKTEWYVSYDEAISASRRGGKPVLMWFTHSKSSPNCKLLDREMFSTKVFEDWADENVIRLRIDSFIQDDNDDRLARKIQYVENLKARYKVLGAPVVVMLSPRGTVIQKYVGYKGGKPEFFFGQLRQAHHVAMKDYGKWREEYEGRGYRMWHDNRGRTVFAKLQRYYKGQLQLVEPDGRTSRTTEVKLSAEDRQWLANEKAKRGIR